MNPWTVTRQAPLSMEFSRQEYWSGLPFPGPGDLPEQGIEPLCPTLQAVSLPSELLGKPLSTYRHSFFIFFIYHRILNIVHSAIQ